MLKMLHIVLTKAHVTIKFWIEIFIWMKIQVNLCLYKSNTILHIPHQLYWDNEQIFVVIRDPYY